MPLPEEPALRQLPLACVSLGICKALLLLYLPTGHWSEGWPPRSLEALPLFPAPSLPITPTPLVYQMFNFGYVTIKIKQLAIPA